MLKSITRKVNGQTDTIKVSPAKASKLIAKGWKPVVVKPAKIEKPEKIKE